MKKLGKLLIIGAIAMMVFYFVDKYIVDKQIRENTEIYIEETSKIDDSDESHKIESETKAENENNNLIDYTAVLEIPSIRLKRGVIDNTKNFNSINYSISVDNNGN